MGGEGHEFVPAVMSGTMGGRTVDAYFRTRDM